MSSLSHLLYVLMSGIPSARWTGGAEGYFPPCLEEYKHIWKEAAAEQTTLPSECGQDEVAINNHKSVKRFSPLGSLCKRLIVIDEATGTCQSFCSLEPGVVIYRSVTFPALPPYLCQRLGDQQIAIYCCPRAHGNEPPICPTAYKPGSGSCSG